MKTSQKLAFAIATVTLLIASPVFAQEPTDDDDQLAPQPAPPPPPPPPKPAPETSEAPPPDVKPIPPKPGPPVGIRGDGGWSSRSLFTIPVTGADLGLGVGAQTSKYAAFWGAARVFTGGTENGLNVFTVRAGGEAELVLADRVRLGAGLSFFLLGVGRYVRDETLLSWGPEVRAHARVDLWQPSGFTIFARAAIEGAWEIYDGSAFWGPTLGGGVDFDIAGKRTR